MKLLLLILSFFIATKTYSQVVKLNTTQNFQFTEGATWNGKNALYFSDMNAKKVYKYVPGTGFSVVRTGQVTNGMFYEPDGTILVCEQGNTNQLVRMDTLGVVKKVLVNKYNSKSFNNPNDLCKDKNGGIYFSDPTWGTQTQDKQAVYYIKPTGECIRISGAFQKPNGVCLSPDGTLLYVVDSNDKNVSVYDVQADGIPINKRVLCVLKVNPGKVSGADGLDVDSEGNLYITTAVGVQVFDKNGTSKKIITIPESPTNVAFGGSDLKTLFITAGTGLYSTQVDVAGITISTSISEIKRQELKVFPNPTSGILNISFAEYQSIKVYNLLGEQIIVPVMNATQNSINLEFLPNGIYFVKIEANKTIYTAKVLVRK